MHQFGEEALHPQGSAPLLVAYLIVAQPTNLPGPIESIVFGLRMPVERREVY
jgi:hypothetical protein